MPLPVLVIVVAAGIALVVAAIHFSGWTRRPSAGDREFVRRRFAEDYPEIAVNDVLLTASGGTAFLPLADGRTGVVHGFGDRQITRILQPADIAGLRRDGPARLTVITRDFSWSGGSFEFDADEAADAVAARLQRPEFGTDARAA